MEHPSKALLLELTKLAQLSCPKVEKKAAIHETLIMNEKKAALDVLLALRLSLANKPI